MKHTTAIRALCLLLFTLSLAPPAFAADTCNSQFLIPQAILERPIVILGELHGTDGTPRLAGEHSCILAIAATEVVLALEIPESEQQRISAYLDSNGSPNDTDALLQGDFWTRPLDRQDGRSSKAMLQLIERIRQLRGANRRISIVAIDGQRPGLTRDGAMAHLVREVVQAKPHARIVALVGNVHALKGHGAFFDKDYRSLAFLLSDLRPLTLNVLPKRGFAWVCIDECGPRKITPQQWVEAKAPGMYVGLDPESAPRYHGTVVLEQVNASPPARAP